MPNPSQYEEAQNDEIEVLRSIYMDDYEAVETKSAWSKASEKSFRLKLRPHSAQSPSVVLCATLTATYPKTLPLLSLKQCENVRERPLELIRSIVNAKPKELLGEVMIYEIATAIQDVLEDVATNVARDRQMPSLEGERVESEAVANKLAKAQEEELLRKQKEERDEEERTMQRMLEEEKRRREIARKNRRSELGDASVDLDVNSSTGSTADIEISFDQPMMLKNRVTASFQSVNIGSEIGMGYVTEAFRAWPAPKIPSADCVVLKKAKASEVSSKALMLKLEDELEKLKRLHHEHVLNVLGFRIGTEQNEWSFDILIEYGNMGSLRDALEIYDTLPVQKARSASIDLLQALDYYHRNGIVHGSIHPGNLFYHKSSGGLQVKLADVQYQSTLRILGARTKKKEAPTQPLPKAWKAPEFAEGSNHEATRKSDIWDFGVLIVQLLFGLNGPQRYPSPATFMNGANLSEPFQDLIRDIFKQHANKRPSAFDLVPYEFLRNDVAAFSPDTSLVSSRQPSSTNLLSHSQRKPRQSSSSAPNAVSRYTNEWDETARLGKGGYGEVVKARNKLDGRIYAIKKITKKTPAELSQVLSEVYLLATLNHPYVVRYYTAWPEEEQSGEGDTSDDVTTSADTSFLSPENDASSLAFGQSTGGLDFISSSGYPKIEFGNDDESDEEETDEESSEDDEVILSSRLAADEAAKASLNLHRTRSSSRAVVKSTLYIQMEYCERQTLRDVIRKGLYDNGEEIWRLLRQVLEGLTHIHGHGIIHRDLKPENIFIDVADNPKIGDFGLATSGQNFMADRAGSGRPPNDDLTRSVGTTLYVAPELRSNVGGPYNAKVDMYSLGIILFEMCHPFKTGMERLQVLGRLREREHSLPSDFQSQEKIVLGDIIQSLIKHRPSERPGSAELLRSGKIPVQIEDETIRIALQGMSNRNSPYYHKMMTALFSEDAASQVKDYLWETGPDAQLSSASTSYILLQELVRSKLSNCYRRHGAVETQREAIFPRSEYYTNLNVVQMFDRSGTLLQLPYDLTLPHARAVAKHAPAFEKTYTFGTVYRENAVGGAPRNNRETDFDIVSRNVKDLALQEAEVLKVVDEIVGEIPALKSTTMCFHISHYDLLEMILEFCRIPVSLRSQVKEVLGKLNIQQWNWAKIRNELRAPSIGVSSTSLDEMAQFDFRDAADKCFARLQAIFKGTVHLPKLHSVFTHISGLVEYLRRMNVRQKVYCCPLSSFNDRFYQGGTMFQCLFDTKKKDVLAAGGRYDSLVEAHRPRGVATPHAWPQIHAVGVKIAWDRLVTIMARFDKDTGNSFLKSAEHPSSNEWKPRRCDCLVASFDPSVLRSRGVKMVADLWANDISAELAVDVGSPEELLNHYKDDKHCWIIMIKNEAVASGKPDLKIKSMETKEDSDVRSTDLFSYLRAELRERDQREGLNPRARLIRHPSHPEQTHDKKNPVQVLTANHKSKKSNKYRVVEAAQNAAQTLAESFLESPIASIETRDEVVDMIQTTRLSDPDSWRRVIQDVSLQDRAYVQDIHKLIESFKTQYESSKCFIYNFRTGKCVDYDLNV